MVDVDGVLVGGRPQDGKHQFTDLEADLGVPLDRLQAEFFAPHWEAIVTGRVAMMDRLIPVLARIAPSVPAERLVDYWFGNDSRIDAEVLAVLDACRSAGCRVYLATNQEHLRARYLMEQLALAEHVDGIFYSAALGERKPGAAFFRLAAQGAGVKPEHIAFVDDSIANVEAATKAGWSAAHWPGSGDFKAVIDRMLADGSATAD